MATRMRARRETLIGSREGNQFSRLDGRGEGRCARIRRISRRRITRIAARGYPRISADADAKHRILVRRLSPEKLGALPLHNARRVSGSVVGRFIGLSSTDTAG